MNLVQDLFFYLTGILFSCIIRSDRYDTHTLFCLSLDKYYSFVSEKNSYEVIEVMGEGYGHLRTLKTNSFSNQSQLKSLILSNVVKKVEPYALNGLSEIQSIHININDIPILEANSFNISGNFPLSLVFNNIKEIEPGAFGNIQKIFLHNNKIIKIRKGVFSNLDIALLNLEDNEISIIEDGAFQGMKKLQSLSLIGNKLKHINVKDIFDKETNLKILQLGHNQLHTIESTTFDFAPSLLYLDLSKNSLNSLPKNTFKNLELLESLSLRKNKLLEIDPDLFSERNNLTYLYLNNNNLTYLSPKFLSKFSNLKKITIYNNPLQCSCKSELEVWSKENNATLLCWNDVKCIENLTNVCNYDLNDVKYDLIDTIDDCTESNMLLISVYHLYYSQIFYP